MAGMLYPLCVCVCVCVYLDSGQMIAFGRYTCSIRVYVCMCVCVYFENGQMVVFGRYTCISFVCLYVCVVCVCVCVCLCAHNMYVCLDGDSVYTCTHTYTYTHQILYGSHDFPYTSNGHKQDGDSVYVPHKSEFTSSRSKHTHVGALAHVHCMRVYRDKMDVLRFWADMS